MKRRGSEISLTGVIKDGRDGGGIASVQVTVVQAESQDRSFEATTDAEGRFQLSFTQSGRYILQAEAAGFRPYRNSSLIVSSQGFHADISMTPVVELRGKVVDERSRVVAGAWVSLRRKGSRIAALPRVMPQVTFSWIMPRLRVLTSWRKIITHTG